MNSRGFSGLIEAFFFDFAREPKSKRQQHDKHPNHGTKIGRRRPQTADTNAPPHTIYRRHYCRDDRGVGGGILAPWPAPHRPQHHALCRITTMVTLVVSVLDTGSRYPRSDARISYVCYSGGALRHRGRPWLDIDCVRAVPLEG